MSSTSNENTDVWRRTGKPRSPRHRNSRLTRGVATMRPFLRASLVALAILFAFALPAAAQRTVVVMTWGGAFMDALNDVKADIENSTGTKIEFVTQASSVAGLQRLEAQKANPQVDLWMTADATAAVALATGIVEPIPVAQIPNLTDIPEKLVFPAGPAIWSSPRGIFYRADKTPFEIKT